MINKYWINIKNKWYININKNETKKVYIDTKKKRKREQEIIIIIYIILKIRRKLYNINQDKKKIIIIIHHNNILDKLNNDVLNKSIFWIEFYADIRMLAGVNNISIFRF